MYKLKVGVVVDEDNGATETFIGENTRGLRDEARLVGDDVVTGCAAAWSGIFPVSDFTGRSMGQAPTSFVHFGEDARRTRGHLYFG